MQWTEEEEDTARGKMDGWASYQSGALVGSWTVDVGPTAELAVTGITAHDPGPAPVFFLPATATHFLPPAPAALHALGPARRPPRSPAQLQLESGWCGSTLPPLPILLPSLGLGLPFLAATDIRQGYACLFPSPPFPSCCAKSNTQNP